MTTQKKKGGRSDNGMASTGGTGGQVVVVAGWPPATGGRESERKREREREGERSGVRVVCSYRVSGSKRGKDGFNFPSPRTNANSYFWSSFHLF